jgi:protein phosphatase
VTWRVVVFVAATVVVFLAALGGTAWFARNTYYVGVDKDGEVTIYRGRPGGLLWFDPTVEQRTGVDLDDVQSSRRAELRAGHEVSSVDKAERYVDNITTTTTTSSTTTTTSPVTTVVAPPP